VAELIKENSISLIKHVLQYFPGWRSGVFNSGDLDWRRQ